MKSMMGCQRLIILCVFFSVWQGISLGQAPLKEVPVPERRRWEDCRVKKITRHFAIYTDLKEKELDFYEAVFEGFFEFFEREYFAVPAEKLLTMYLFSGMGSYGPYVKRTTGAPTSYGYYLPDANLIVVNLDSGLGTATHELVHYFVRTAMPRPISAFVNEGFAAFFEKFIGYLDARNRLHLTLGYFSNWRFPITKKNVDKLSLEALMKSDDVDQCAARSFMLYLHRNDKLKPFINAYRGSMGDKSGIQILEEVMALRLNEVEAGWKRWIRDTPIDTNVFLVERAFVLPHDRWLEWEKIHANSVRWNDKMKVYEAVSAK